MTFGLFRPTVLMPSDAGEWTEKYAVWFRYMSWLMYDGVSLDTHLLARTALFFYLVESAGLELVVRLF